MKRTTILTTGLLAAFAVTTLGTAVMAHQKGGGQFGPRPAFEELDADGDGKITAAELATHRAAHLAAADSNGDGLLSAEELMAQAEARQGKRVERRVDRMIERLDSNDDGLLSLEEIAARFDGSRMIERLDSDGDGAVSAEEFAQMGEGRGERGKPGRHGGGGGGAGRN